MKPVYALFLVLMSLTVAGAQESNVRIAGEVSVNRGSGFENPIVGVTVGGTKEFNDRLNLSVEGKALLARKVVGGGFNLAAAAEIRVNVTKQFFVLGGLNAHRQFTEFYEKVGTEPFAGGGVRSPNKRTFISARVYFDDLTGLSRAQARARPADLNFENRIGLEGRFEHYKPMGSRFGLYFAANAGARWFDCMTGPGGGPTSRCSASFAGARVGVYRKM